MSMDRVTKFTQRWLPLGRTILALLLVALAGAVTVTSPAPAQSSSIPNNLSTQSGSTSRAGSAPRPGLLPGAEIWNDGVSSFMFGTNDGYQWSEKNVETQPAIQLALRKAGITLMRTFIPDNASDSVIEQRIATIENIGAHCLAVLPNIKNTRFNEHVVSYLGNRCLLYEFGNEPDYERIPVDDFIAAWNATIPLLRHLNPSAKFIGPTVINAAGIDNQYLPRFLQGVKASGVLPDAISINYYSCWRMDEATCLASASTYAGTAQKVRGFIKSILGKELPIGFTEWNYDPRNPPPDYGDKADFITKFTTTAIKSMIAGGVAFACQFDAAGYAGYGRLDMFDVNTGQPKPQFDALAAMIKQYKPAVPTANGPTLLSQGAAITCSSNNSGPGGSGVLTDRKFGDWGFWQLQTSLLPGSCAIHLKNGASKVLFAWFSDYSFDFTDATSLAPQDYDIAVSSNSTNGSDGTWQNVVSVRGNHARAREHTFAFAGMSWIRMTALAGQPNPTQPYVRVDELEVFDAQSLGTNTFFFSGDSITAMSFSRYASDSPAFADLVARCAPQRYPLMIDGGMGGQTSDGAVQQLASWQNMLPDMHYWLLGWGTNDALNDISPDAFRTKVQTLVTAILQRGDVPILAHIPYAAYHGNTSLDAEIQQLNKVIDEVTASNGLIPGPDLYGLVRAHPEYLGPDQLHPNGAGSVAINALWFQVLRPHLGLGDGQCQ